jgi:hypothetical protein
MAGVPGGAVSIGILASSWPAYADVAVSQRAATKYCLAFNRQRILNLRTSPNDTG